jgi:hypothetical protein
MSRAIDKEKRTEDFETGLFGQARLVKESLKENKIYGESV